MVGGIKKVEAEIKGLILGFESSRYLVNKPKSIIIIRCESDKLEQAIDARFNYSSKWTKLNLKAGDKVKFKATIKVSPFAVHKVDGWVDDWGNLPLEMSDTLVVVEILNPKQISLER